MLSPEQIIAGVGLVVVEVVLWELQFQILCLGLVTVLCRATAAGLTCSDTGGDFQEGKICV